jgi:hypothetical protein
MKQKVVEWSKWERREKQKEDLREEATRKI